MDVYENSMGLLVYRITAPFVIVDEAEGRRFTGFQVYSSNPIFNILLIWMCMKIAWVYWFTGLQLHL